MNAKFPSLARLVIAFFLSVPFIAGLAMPAIDFLLPQRTHRLSLISSALPSLAQNRSLYQPLGRTGEVINEVQLRFNLPSSTQHKPPLKISLIAGAAAPRSVEEARSRTLSAREIVTDELVSGENWTWDDLRLASPGGILLEYPGAESDGISVWGTDSSKWKISPEEQVGKALLLRQAESGELFSAPQSAHFAMGYGRHGPPGLRFIRDLQALSSPRVLDAYLCLAAIALSFWAASGVFPGPQGRDLLRSAPVYLLAGFMFLIALSLVASGMPPYLLNQGVSAESFYEQF